MCHIDSIMEEAYERSKIKDRIREMSVLNLIMLIGIAIGLALEF